MYKKQVTEKLWIDGIQQFFYIPHLIGDTLLIKKCLSLQNTLFNVYYYIIETNNGIERYTVKHAINKPVLNFTFYLIMKPFYDS